MQIATRILCVAEIPVYHRDLYSMVSMSRLFIVTYLFNLYAKCIMWNAGLDEVQAGIKISGRNINNFRYVDDTTLMEESEQELKHILMKVKEESEKVCLKLNI